MLSTARSVCSRACAAAGYEEPCWGYHFDFQSRVFFYRSGEPNTIATAFAGHALLDAHRGDSMTRRLLDRAHGVGRFFMRHVPLTEDGEGAVLRLPAGRPLPDPQLEPAGRVAAGPPGRPRRATPRSSRPRPGPRCATRPPASAPTAHGPTGSCRISPGSTTSTRATCSTHCGPAPTAGSAQHEADEAWTKGIAYYRRADVPRRWRARSTTRTSSTRSTRNRSRRESRRSRSPRAETPRSRRRRGRCSISRAAG